MTYEPSKSPFPKDRFLNPELSWLDFNARVLQEAKNRYHPLLERLKFLSISAQNLDEFYMVRVAGLKSQASQGVKKTGYGTPPIKKQLMDIHIEAEKLIAKQQESWKKFIFELRQEKIDILTVNEYLPTDSQWLKEYFLCNIAPLLHITIVRKQKDFPLIPNLGLAACVFLKNGKNQSKAIINIPSSFNRFIQLPALRKTKPENQRIRFAALEDVMTLFAGLLFPDLTINKYCMMHVIRDSELDVSDDADDLFINYEAALKKRKRGEVIRIAMSKDAPIEVRSFLIEQLNVDTLTVVQGSEFLSLSHIMELHEKESMEKPMLKYITQAIRFPERINDYGGDCFAAIDTKDIIVHHPYESFEVVVKFLQQAAIDPYVTHIKQTLYRIGPENSIIGALIDAAKAGKNVTVIVELKARFDEAANLNWGKDLQDAGAQVIYGIPGLKIHAKMSLIKRQRPSSKHSQSYVHFGTGNYHPQNARIYSDLSFFTCDKALCSDAEKIFLFLEGYGEPKDLEKISVAPFNLRETFISLIEQEISFAKAGKPAFIWLKLNSLADKQLIDKLYEASNAGVKIELIVRGVCCLKSNIEGLSENIHVRSIIGRFLEHSRIYCFGNGHALPSPRAKIFIGPTDLIKHKLNGRIELIIPIENPTVHEQVLGQIMQSNLKDKKQTWIMQPDSTYVRQPFTKTSFSAHEFFLSNPSLSGRGLALQKQSGLFSDNTSRNYTSYSPGDEIAVLDIGSNSVRMVVYDGLKRAPLTLFNEKVSCGLAKDLEKSGKLNVQGTELALASIKRFVHIIEAMNVKEFICFATSAVRDASDGNKFIKKVQKQCKLSVQILSGEEEAYLAAMGIASAFYKISGVVGDLGGGSLELSQIIFDPDGEDTNEKNNGVKHCKSFPIGALRLHSLAKQNFAKTQDIIESHITQYPLKESLKGKTFCAVGGGFRALAKVNLSLNNHPLNVLEHYTVTPSAMLKTIKYVVNLPSAKLSTLSGMSSNRAKTLKHVATLLERIILIGEPSYITFSTHGVREGILFDRLEAFTQGNDGLISGCSDMIKHISPEASIQDNIVASKDCNWVEYGEALYKWIAPTLNGFSDSINISNTQRLHLAACILNRLAWHESADYRGEMAFRWIIDSKIPAMNHVERIIIATALFYRYQSKDDPSITRKPHSLLTASQIKHARSLGIAMRLGYQISGGAKDIFEHVTLAIKGDKLLLSSHKEYKSLLNAEIAKRHQKLAESMGLIADIC